MGRYKRQVDQEKWDAAQVTTMDEFKKMLEKAAVAQIQKAEKYVEAQVGQQVSHKLEQISQDTASASKDLGDFLQQAEDLAADGEADEEELSEEELAEFNESKVLEEEAIARTALLEELSQMASEAANQGNYKVAYKIERTIDSILYDEE